MPSLMPQAWLKAFSHPTTPCSKPHARDHQAWPQRASATACDCPDSAGSEQECNSMHAGDPPTFKRGAPGSAAVRQQGPLGAQKSARRGAAGAVTQGRKGAANAFLPPQLKGRWDP